MHRVLAMKTGIQVMELWQTPNTLCVLHAIDHELELRLYAGHDLVLTQPCQSVEEALDVSLAWRLSLPPRRPF
jgi:hypothetical protein